ncbi:hypothetical protein BD410DRAFT_844210 [Rickenella mellea]|uniref:Uncharacterized protein n=1 Tax=Rickenella mellea TaxID=50990 RepID=A0A4Y7PNJ5_9AGAM|nr:hypothetical protein BD410DRAFT_844210 [Rickenella mellea]
MDCWTWERSSAADSLSIADYSYLRNRSDGEEGTYDDNGEATERGSVTDMEDYQDARARLSRGPSARLSSSGSGSKAVEGGVAAEIGVGAVATARIAGEVSYESQAVSTDAFEQPPVPPTPAPGPWPTPQKGFGLYRVGSSVQQFHFISPPPSAPATFSHIPPSQISSASQRDSNATIGAYHRFPIPSMTSSRTDRRMSIESTLSSNADDAAKQQRPHTQTVSMGLPVDKAHPPTMVLPTERDAPPPPRPTSPPPPKLIHHATTPTIGAWIESPAYVDTEYVTTSFRSAANTAQLAVFDARPRLRSTASLLSDQEEDVCNRRSSMSSDHFLPPSRTLTQNGTASGITNPVTPSRNNTTISGPMGPMGAAGGSTDPAIIHVITQTMIGEFLYEHTRKSRAMARGGLLVSPVYEDVVLEFG